DRGARPGIAQVAGIGLARAEVRLVDPGAGVPVAVAAVADAAHVGQRLVGVGEDDLLTLPAPLEVADDLGERLERVLGGVAAGDHGRLRVDRPRSGWAGERLLARLARGLAADDGVEVGL